MDTLRLTEEQRAMAGDPDLIRRARIKAQLFAKSHCLKWLVKDLESAALVGLCDAARTFNPARGVTFRWHALKRVDGALIDCWRSERPMAFRRWERCEGSRPVVCSLELFQFRDTPDFWSGDLPVGWEVESEDAVEALGRKLPRKQGLALRVFYLCAAPAGLRATSRAMGLSEARISQLIRQGLETLRDEVSL